MQTSIIRTPPERAVIAVVSERNEHERRVALDVRGVRRVLEQRHAVRIQSRAGIGAAQHDADYDAVEGVVMCDDAASTLRGAGIVLRVTPPSPAELEALAEGTLLIAPIRAWRDPALFSHMQARKLSVIALELIPRIARMQPMNVLSSQATVSGYKAALLAAELSPRLFPLLMTAAGTITPARVMVIGAGVAGMQAIATARRLGARVEATDVRRAANQQIRSLGAHMLEAGFDAEERIGVARRLNDQEQHHQREIIAARLPETDVVITAVQASVRPAPLILTEDMVELMPAQSVVVDMAADSGGNCSLSVPGETISHGHCTIAGPLDLPSRGAVHASRMLSNNFVALLDALVEEPNFDGHRFTAVPEDDALQAMLMCLDGVVLKDAEGRSSTNADTPLLTGKGEAGVEHAAAQSSLPLDVDPLQQIDGIGPVLEGKLHEFGFYRFSDIAALGERERIRLEQQLELDDGEILSQGWIEQARTLAGEGR